MSRRERKKADRVLGAVLRRVLEHHYPGRPIVYMYDLSSRVSLRTPDNRPIVVSLAEFELLERIAAAGLTDKEPEQ